MARRYPYGHEYDLARRTRGAYRSAPESGRRGRYDAPLAEYPGRGRREGAPRYDRERGYDRGWGMTRMNRHMLRGRIGPYNPPIHGANEYSARGAGPRGETRQPPEGRPLRPRGRHERIHAVGFIRDRYDSGWY